uniref:NADH-ubiquinone oxidoreductase chain 4 n=1 Tax=Chauliognathus opacus TaxID=528223 RepID=D1G5K4_CHAOP|nr:NADH dehydrogenase subunit 4 [Chauliognathus opacus]ACM45019.1 NADH dehydrogenase subunit 4 [Chauliognathus opacus]
MKFIMYMLFMIPLCFLNSFNYMVFSFTLLFFLFLINFNLGLYFTGISYYFGSDLFSYLLIALTLWIGALMFLASLKVNFYNNYTNLFSLVVFFLIFFLFLTFSAMNFFMFYIFFEASLVPTLILILGWGYQPERIQAGVYMLFYTLFASLPMMISLFYIYSNLNSLFYYKFNLFINSFFVFFFTIFVFLVKIPMFMVHLWLPKAHVEAPVSGSMILAGIMLKLGGYGIFRVLYIYSNLIKMYGFYFILFSLLGGVLVSLQCLRQNDVKSLVAYSSVAHMSMVLSGFMTLNYWGVMGAYLMMISHGLCSSGLFCLANIGYERLASRSLFLNKGLLNVMPSMSLLWFLLISSNMAAPPSLNLLSEIFLINSIVSWSMMSMFLLMLLSFFSASYSLYLFTITQHGALSNNLFSFNLGTVREYLLLILHWLPLNLLFMTANSFI